MRRQVKSNLAVDWRLRAPESIPRAVVQDIVRRRFLVLVRGVAGRAQQLGLLRQFAILSLIPVVALGVVLAVRLQDVIEKQALFGLCYCPSPLCSPSSA
jgi:energy-converting hydrogenase Eha subunit H